MMRVARSVIVWSFLLGAALLAEAFPFPGTGMETNSINQEPNSRAVARWIHDGYEEKFGPDDFEAAESSGDAIDEWNLGDGGKDDPRILDNFANDGELPVYEFPSDGDLEKRAIRKQKYKYYRCYFNPVTCYRK